MINILRQAEDETDAHLQFQRHFKLIVSRQDFQDLVSKTFRQVAGDQPEAMLVVRKNYLTLKTPLLKAHYSNLLATPFAKLFSQRVFWPVLCAAFVLNILFCALTRFNEVLPRKDVLAISVLIGISMLIHELGHIAACKKFGIRHGEIGFAFYFIFPIVYADITQIWSAPRAKRIIANLGGIYLELIYASILFIGHLITSIDCILWAAVGVFVKAITELNPFMRYDGYWLLSDITNTPNLLLKSKQSVHNFLSKSFTTDNKNESKTTGNGWIVLYASLNSLTIAFYFFYVIIAYNIRILRFPTEVFSMLIHVSQFEFSTAYFPEGFLWILGLYILGIKTLISITLRALKLTLA